MNNIRKALFGGAVAAAATFAAVSTPALATKPVKVDPPTLHGFCSLADPCSDNSVNTPTSVNPPGFGFAASPGSGATGTLWVDILVPDNVTLPASFTISGALLGVNTFTALLFDANGATPGTPAWTS